MLPTSNPSPRITGNGSIPADRDGTPGSPLIRLGGPGNGRTFAPDAPRCGYFRSWPRKGSGSARAGKTGPPRNTRNARNRDATRGFSWWIGLRELGLGLCALCVPTQLPFGCGGAALGYPRSKLRTRSGQALLPRRAFLLRRAYGGQDVGQVGRHGSGIIRGGRPRLPRAMAFFIGVHQRPSVVTHREPEHSSSSDARFTCPGSWL